MIRKTRGIVLHTTSYGESSLVVHCYTEQAGQTDFHVKRSPEIEKTEPFQPLSAPFYSGF